jgi:hypothetical protein
VIDAGSLYAEAGKHGTRVLSLVVSFSGKCFSSALRSRKACVGLNYVMNSI